jgi:Tfp pilus assembly protein PilZ
MNNTRRYKRFKVDVMEINGKMLLARYVKIKDISIGGLSLQTERMIRIGSEYALRIEGKGRVLSVSGVVIWSLLGQSITDSEGNIVPLYTAGMKFTDGSSEKEKEIIDFLEAYKRDADIWVNINKPDGSRLYVRICIEDPEKAVLHFQENYKVINLNLGGMLIESGHALEVGSKLPMEMTLPDDRSILFLGRVAYCRLTEQENLVHYDIGIEFIDMQEQGGIILKEFIRLLDNMDMSSSTR